MKSRNPERTMKCLLVVVSHPLLLATPGSLPVKKSSYTISPLRRAAKLSSARCENRLLPVTRAVLCC